jgi:hypothetical protein
MYSLLSEPKLIEISLVPGNSSFRSFRDVRSKALAQSIRALLNRLFPSIVDRAIAGAPMDMLV